MVTILCTGLEQNTISGVKGIAIVSFGRILYCMVVRLSQPKEWTIGLSLIIGHAGVGTIFLPVAHIRSSVAPTIIRIIRLPPPHSECIISFLFSNLGLHIN